MRRLSPFAAATLLFAPGAAAAQAPEILRLETLIDRVEKRFPKLLGAEAERQAAAAKGFAKQGAFDPVVTAGVESLRYNSASSRGKPATGTDSEIGIEVTTIPGVKLAAGRVLNTGSVKSPDSATGADGTYFVSLKVPLLRGAGVNEKSIALRQARLAEPLARQEARALRQSIVLDLSLAYWEWVGAVARLRVRESLLRLADDRLRFVQREIELKQRAPIDGIEADAEAALRRADRTKAQRDVEKAAIKLQKFLWDDDLRPGPAPDPAQAPGDDEAFAPRVPDDDAVAAGWARAQELRPELQRLAIQRRSVGLDAALARNDLKPSVELVYAPGLDTGRRGIDNTLKAGITFSVPLWRRDATGRLDEARRKDDKFEQEERLTRQSVRLEIDDAVSAIRRAAERWADAERNLALTLQVERGERTRFREGDTTLFLLNQRERQSADAASRRIDARVDYEQAWSLFRAATVQN